MKEIKRDRLKIKFCEFYQRLGAKLHLSPPVMARYKFTVKNHEDKPIFSTEGKCNSFVRNYYNHIASQSLYLSAGIGTGGNASGVFGDGVDIPAKNTAGVLQLPGAGLAPVRLNSGSDGFMANAGVTTNGIVVGSSDLAESFDAFKLDNLIDHGTGAGQLQYGAGSTPAVRAFNNTTKVLTSQFTRAFTNSSAGNVTIREFGVYGLYSAGTSFYMMTIRDVLVTPIVLTPGQILTLSYELSMVMSN